LKNGEAGAVDPRWLLGHPAAWFFIIFADSIECGRSPEPNPGSMKKEETDDYFVKKRLKFSLRVKIRFTC